MATKNYSPYSAITNILNSKKQWEDAYKAGNTTEASTAAENARKYYEELRSNNYADVADKLSKSDYTGAKAIQDAYASTAGVAIRPFFEQYLGNGKTNLSSNDINKLIKFDDNTGLVSFAGTNLGKPNAAAGGVSYWDEDYLKEIADNYIKMTGADNYNGVQGNAMYNDRMNSAASKNDEQWDELKKYGEDYKAKSDEAWGIAKTPYGESSDLKAAQEYIMPYYNNLGNKTAYNAVASGAATNGGNIDSFAAANAVNQRNAQIAQGQKLAYELGLGAYQGRIDNVFKFLENMGYQRESLTNQQNSNIATDSALAQQAFENAETYRTNTHTMNEEAKNNEAAREEVYSSITGLVSPSVKYRDYFYDDYGNINSTLLDGLNVQTIINDLDVQIRNASTPEEKAALEEEKRGYEELRTLKILSNWDKYGQYADKLVFSDTPTAAMSLANKQLEADARTAELDNQYALKLQSAKNSGELDKIMQQYIADKDLLADEIQGNLQVQALKNAGKTTSDDEEYIDTHGATIKPVAGTLDASASDEAERKVLKGYESAGLNNLSARFINELYDIAKANNTDDIPEAEKDSLSIRTILNQIANRSDAYGLTINDVYSILDYLDMGAYKSYFKQIEKTGRTDEPGVMLVKNI